MTAHNEAKKGEIAKTVLMPGDPMRAKYIAENFLEDAKLVNGDVISDVEIVGGCPGNSVGVSKLCVGRTLDEVISILSGIDCRGRGTSCPDQLAVALVKLKEQLSVLN